MSDDPDFERYCEYLVSVGSPAAEECIIAEYQTAKRIAAARQHEIDEAVDDER